MGVVLTWLGFRRREWPWARHCAHGWLWPQQESSRQVNSWGGSRVTASRPRSDGIRREGLDASRQPAAAIPRPLSPVLTHDLRTQVLLRAHPGGGRGIDLLTRADVLDLV